MVGSSAPPAAVCETLMDVRACPTATRRLIIRGAAGRLRTLVDVRACPTATRRLIIRLSYGDPQRGSSADSLVLGLRVVHGRSWTSARVPRRPAARVVYGQAQLKSRPISGANSMYCWYCYRTARLNPKRSRTQKEHVLRRSFAAG